jgi:hypothetical protein
LIVAAQDIGEIIEESAARMLAGEESPHERAFRRGYHHAYEAAIRHVRAGATVTDLCRHGDRVQGWREGYGSDLRCTPPPAFDKGTG